MTRSRTPQSKALGRRRRTHLLWIVAAVALASVACSGGEDAAEASVASVADVTGSESENSASDSEEPSTALDADDAALEFSQCMRDEGLDFPDIGVDANGNPAIRDAFSSSDLDPGSDEFRSAIEACRSTLADAGFGARGGGRADDPEFQDALVEYSECLRDEGLDVGDVQLGGGQGNGGAPPAGEDAPERGQGQGRGRFGDPSERIADSLGLDAQDPAVAAALESCQPILETVFAGAAPGAGQE